METLCRFDKTDCYGAKELNVLLEISLLLSNKEVDLDAVIGLLANHLGVKRLFLTVLNRESHIIRIEGAFGVTQEEREEAVYHVGEGIIGKVIEKGETVLLISQ